MAQATAHLSLNIGARLHETVVETRSVSPLRDKHIKGGYDISAALVFVIVSCHFLMQQKPSALRFDIAFSQPYLSMPYLRIDSVSRQHPAELLSRSNA